MKCKTPILLFLLGACAPEPTPRYGHMCSTPEDKEALAAWVLSCVENGNPMSDEEPEDLVRACTHQGRAILCPTTKTIKGIPCSEAPPELVRYCDGAR